jgi:glycosyltransferase involved in cell wall biosynthesis
LAYSTALLVPVYNGQKFIAPFHKSVQDLKTAFGEIVFFDDGSTDESSKQLELLGYKVVRSKENKGPSAARNQLLRYTNADWIHFHDIDDLIDPSYLIETTKLIKDDCDAIICDADWVTESEDKILSKWEYKNSLYNSMGPAYLLKNPVGGINGLYRKSTLLELGGFDESLKIWEDSDLNLRLALKNKKILFTENVLVKAIRHSESTSSNSHRIRKYKCEFLKKYLLANEIVLIQQIKEEANNLFHQVVYNKDWQLYDDVYDIFRILKVVPPLTKTYPTTALKIALGPKLFTLLKLQVLKRVFHLKISHD